MSGYPAQPLDPGRSPRNHESAGKQKSGRTRKGNVRLKTILVSAATSSRDSVAAVGILAIATAYPSAALLGYPVILTKAGGGIAASADAFALVTLGHAGVRLYDASLSEWATDPMLPMETG